MPETVHGPAAEGQRADGGVRPFSEVAGAGTTTSPVQQALSEAIAERSVAGADHDADDLALLNAQRAIASFKTGAANPFNRPTISTQSTRPGAVVTTRAATAQSPCTQAPEPSSLLRPPIETDHDRPLSEAIAALRVLNAPRTSQRASSDEVAYSYSRRPKQGPPIACLEPRVCGHQDAASERESGSGSTEPSAPNKGLQEPPHVEPCETAVECGHAAVEPAAADGSASIGPNDPDAWRAELQPTARRQRRLTRSERKISAAILRENATAIAEQERAAFRFDWMTADDVSRSPEELASIERRRAELADRIVQADGSELAQLCTVFSDEELKTARFMARDDVTGVFTACEWGRLWRADQLAGNSALHACWGVREDGSAVRDWTSQRARATFVVAWIAWRARRAGRALLRDHGILLAQGVPVSLFQVLCAPYGKETLHRNALSGTHRAGSTNNPDLGYIRALENSHYFEAIQHGDRKIAPRQCNTYRVRVTVPEETLDRNERALRQMIRNWWQSLSEVGEIVVRRARRLIVDAKLHAAIRGELLAPTPS